MTRNPVLASCLLSLAALTTAPAARAELSAEQIVDKNVAARGGLAAWRAVTSLTIEGKLDAGGKPSHELPYVLKQKRPHKNRLEIVFKDQTSVQVYDGAQGWKVRPFLNRNEVESYTPAEAKSAAQADEFDGPLIDYAAKGTQIKLAGSEQIEGHPAYKLSLKLKNGGQRNVWLDAGTFLEVKADGEPRKLDGKMHGVQVYFRDYKPEHGLILPHLQETLVEGAKDPYKMTVTKVTVNEALGDTLFQKPSAAASPESAAKKP